VLLLSDLIDPDAGTWAEVVLWIPLDVVSSSHLLCEFVTTVWNSDINFKLRTLPGIFAPT